METGEHIKQNSGGAIAGERKTVVKSGGSQMLLVSSRGQDRTVVFGIMTVGGKRDLLCKKGRDAWVGIKTGPSQNRYSAWATEDGH